MFVPLLLVLLGVIRDVPMLPESVQCEVRVSF